MKRILLLLVGVLVLAGCEDKKDNGKLDPEAKVYISPAEGVKADAENPNHLTAREIVEQANALYSTGGVLGVDEWNRDVENTKFIWGSGWVITSDGELNEDGLNERDAIFVTLDDKNHPVDTIAYISNKTMDETSTQLRKLFSEENYAACYKLFEEAYVFIPTTGAEWRALKAAGNN